MTGAAADAALVALVIVATGLPTGVWATMPDRQRTRDARILARLAPVPVPANADDPQRSPDWCHSHNCHKSACPTPEH